MVGRWRKAETLHLSNFSRRKLFKISGCYALQFGLLLEFLENRNQLRPFKNQCPPPTGVCLPLHSKWPFTICLDFILFDHSKLVTKRCLA